MLYKDGLTLRQINRLKRYLEEGGFKLVGSDAILISGYGATASNIMRREAQPDEYTGIRASDNGNSDLGFIDVKFCYPAGTPAKKKEFYLAFPDPSGNPEHVETIKSIADRV